MNENENLQNPVPNTGRKINTDRIKKFKENTAALEGALSQGATDTATPKEDKASKKARLRVVGNVPHTSSEPVSETKSDSVPEPSVPTFFDLDDDFIDPSSLNFGNSSSDEDVEEPVGTGGEDPIDDEEVPVEKSGIDLAAFAASVKAKIDGAFKRKSREYDEDEDEEEPEYEEETVREEAPKYAGTPTYAEAPKDTQNEEEPEYRVVSEELIPYDDRRQRRGCNIIAGLALGAVILLIGGREVIRWLDNRVDNITLNVKPEVTASPNTEQVPEDALVNPDDLVTPETSATPAPEITVNPEEVASEFYGYLQECETKSRENASTIQSKMDVNDPEYSAYEEFKFILPNGKDTILNMYCALHPELGVSSNLSIDEVITLCNQIAANCHSHYLKSNLTMLLQGCDEQIVEKIDKLDDLAASIKLENYNGDFKEGLYTPAEEEAAKAAGANITEGNLFFTNLKAIYENLSTDDVNNIPIYCVLDSFYTGVAYKIPTYINHFTAGANSSIEYLLKDEEMLNEENYQKFYAPHNTETLPKIDEETIASSTNDYFTLLSNYEKEYNVKFNNVTKENVDKLYNYFNGLDIMNPEEAYNLCFEISTVCKANNINPRFEMLLNNEKYSNMIKEYYNKISVLKVDYDPSDDKLLYSYLGENIATGTGMINYNDPKQNSLFVLIKAIFDSYKAETLYYVNVGKNGEFYVNGDVYYSCAMGIRDAINAEYDAIVETYQRSETLKRSI